MVHFAEKLNKIMKTSVTLLILLALSYVVNAQNKAEELYTAAIYQKKLLEISIRLLYCTYSWLISFPVKEKWWPMGYSILE